MLQVRNNNEALVQAPIFNFFVLLFQNEGAYPSNPVPLTLPLHNNHFSTRVSVILLVNVSSPDQQPF